ncbi:hypothetical protein DFO77_11361 [Marinilabilia salmonicolor]|jgi:hypothetical protein|uniref:Uncharacterized protein n=1 Tax=Marinilabilia salmonicolor TaxID=989 RepID=A0A2T0XCK6_9BACT|nr:hypothetical protein BY457_11459 [Marinilabilia salmonicolor]RCW33296.1 hypothetical protein DFO77_11361 [Marinilabilia salmonicolor]
MSRKNYYFERRLLRSARNDSVLKWLVGLVGVDFRQSRKSTPTNPQYPAKARYCGRSEAISIF